ncbi:ABC transporter substrate-binding protein [Streptomyces sp. NPDC051940]|uniref:ABC transporter substrate-binding protein n=1 Tax=Streptomyces sp. NPDC051940 TaxID=3155675 RepID=UPI003412DF2F
MMRRTLALPALLGLVAPMTAACGGAGSDGDGSAIVVGTTDVIAVSKDAPAPLDPAFAYDINSWNVLQNTMQGLLRLPRSGSEPEPDAAKECHFADTRSSQFRCTMRDGLEFSNGHELTAEDVKYSIERMLRIDNQEGPVGLLTNIDAVETPGNEEIVFHLKSPDATFPLKLATPAAAIVDKDEYRPNALREGLGVVGSGPYTLDVETEKGHPTKLVFTRNGKYQGNLEIKNDKVELRVFAEPGADNAKAMEEALKAGDVDVVNRSLNPGQIEALRARADQDLQFQETSSMGIRYLVFNMNLPTSKEKAVRQAVAQVVDREQLVRDVYKHAAEPLYSMIPQGVLGNSTAFYDKYKRPDADRARGCLADAGIPVPVPLTLDYTTDHYGAATKAEFEELKSQLDESGLFDVTIRGTEWKRFARDFQADKYAVFGLGWYPDFPDAETFVAPFVGPDNQNSTGNHYRNPDIEERVKASRQEAQRARVIKTFEHVQDLVADEVPVLPLWQGKEVIAASDSVSGVEWALNSSSTIQLWELEHGLAE